MDLARYVDEEGIRSEVEAGNITKKLNEQIYRGRLYCEYEGCNAELVYNERQKGAFKRYFSTLKGSKHKEKCENEILHEGIKAPSNNIGGEDINLSDKHIKKSLDDAYKQFLKKVSPREKESVEDKKTKTKKKTIPKVDKNEVATRSIGGIPVTTGEGKNVVEGREPYIYKREVSEIEEKDIGYTREIHALVEEMRLYEGEAFVDLVGLDGSNFSVYMGTPFKNNHNQEFELLHNFKKHIKEQKHEGKLIICTSIGEVTKINGVNVVQVYNYKNVRIDNLNIIQFIESKRNLI